MILLLKWLLKHGGCASPPLPPWTRRCRPALSRQRPSAASWPRGMSTRCNSCASSFANLLETLETSENDSITLCKHKFFDIRVVRNYFLKSQKKALSRGAGAPRTPHILHFRRYSSVAFALFLCVGRGFVLFFFAFETLRIPRRLTIPKIFV